MQTGDFFELSKSVQAAAKTTYNYAKIIAISNNGNLIEAVFEDDNSIAGNKVAQMPVAGITYSFQLYDVYF